MDRYYFEEYIKTLNLDSPTIQYQKISSINSDLKLQLAKMYCTLFNADNKNFIAMFGTTGRTVPEGLWTEEPYSIDTALSLILDYMSAKYIGIVATTGIPGLDEIKALGACIYKKSSFDELSSKGYEVPFLVPDSVELWSGIDTFRRPAQIQSQPLKDLSSKMRNELVNSYKTKNSILMYSSTNNPVMVNALKKDNFTIVEKLTTFGNRFQAFKIIS